MKSTRQFKSFAATLLIVAGSASLAIVAQPAVAQQGSVDVCSEESQFSHRRLDSKESDNLCQRFKGKVMLVVNTASRCGFTYQYEGLEKLYQTYRDRGLVVVGFPSNDFGNQEPGSEKTIKEFCRLTYGVAFPMYAKTRVIGDDAHPLYKALTAASGRAPQWNFHKYLIDREGRVVEDFTSFTKPDSKDLLNAIESLL